MRAFWAPTTSTSIPQASVRHSITPDAADAVDHQQRRAGTHDAADGLDVVPHAGARLLQGRDRRPPRRGAAGGAGRRRRPANGSPHGTWCRTTWMPNRSAISRQRSANLPDSSTMALPPRGTRFTTAASMAPVPELVSTSTSFCVLKDVFQALEHLGHQARNSGVRWCVTWRAKASRADSGTGRGAGSQQAMLSHGPSRKESKSRGIGYSTEREAACGWGVAQLAAVREVPLSLRERAG